MLNTAHLPREESILSRHPPSECQGCYSSAHVLQGMANIHAILPDGRVVTNVEVFRCGPLHIVRPAHQHGTTLG